MKKVFFGTVVFGLGAVAGYFTAKKMLRTQYQNDVAEVQAFYYQKLEELGVMEEGFDPLDDNEEEEEVEDDPASELITAYRADGRKLHYDYTKPPLGDLRRKIVSGSVLVEPNGEELLGVIDDDEEDEYIDAEYEAELEQSAEDFMRRQTENMQKGEPYLIDADEYHQGPKEYERQALYYYVEDRVLCEDNDEEVDDEEACVGLDYEDKLTMQTTCWVRNDTLKMLYEIHRIDDSFKRAVLGIVETPREREFRIQGRRKKGMDNHKK